MADTRGHDLDQRLVSPGGSIDTISMVGIWPAASTRAGYKFTYCCSLSFAHEGTGRDGLEVQAVAVVANLAERDIGNGVVEAM